MAGGTLKKCKAIDTVKLEIVQKTPIVEELFCSSNQVFYKGVFIVCILNSLSYISKIVLILKDDISII